MLDYAKINLIGNADSQPFVGYKLISVSFVKVQ